MWAACNGASGSPVAWDGGQAPGAYSKVTLPRLGEAAQPFPSVFAGEILTFSSSLPFLSAWPLLGAGSACRTRCAAGEPAGALFVLATAVFNRHLRAPRFFHAPAHSSGAEAPFLGPGDGNEHCPSRFPFPTLKDLGGTKDSRC